MPKKNTYIFDNESCSFVEVVDSRRKIFVRVSVILLMGLVIAASLTWGLDQIVKSPQEVALLGENEALQRQLESVNKRIDSVTGDLMEIRDTDQDLYRVLLNARQISDDVAQVGIGGSDPYPEFSRFGSATSELLTENATKIDRLERLLILQNDSYHELRELAGSHSIQLSQMPAIQPVNGRITSGFGIRFHPVLKVSRMHPGLDFHAPVGSPVYATGDGIIKDAKSGGGLGRFVKVEHKTAGYVTVYAHLSKIAPGIRRRNKINRGDLLGYSGNTGLSEAPHLHYEVRDLDGKSLNPIYFLAPSVTPAEYERLLKEAESTTFLFD